VLILSNADSKSMKSSHVSAEAVLDPGAAGRILLKGQTAGKQRQDHLTCRKTLYATITTSVATNKTMPKKRIFITIGIGLAYKPLF
jgi:hypothetical protein